MSAPRLDIDLDKITDNARSLVERLAPRGIRVTGVTKAALGHPLVAAAMRRGGVHGLGDSRIENIETIRDAAIPGPFTLIRSPMASQVNRVVTAATTSFNTEPDVLDRLSAAAYERHLLHSVILMVELGDLREGVLVDDLFALVRHTLDCPNLILSGLGTNLACQSGIAPDAAKMGELSRLVDSVEAKFGITLDVVSGGNSANLDWALGDADTGRVNELRLGESILLGRDPLHGRVLDGLHTDAITLVAEIIESKAKPVQPWGDVGRSAFGVPEPRTGDGTRHQALLALGRQDVDPDGITPPAPVTMLGASSDHLVVDMGVPTRIGTEVEFQLDYAALLRAMTSPHVAKEFVSPSGLQAA
ncbi:MAG: alanine/ornithine racemase family PLP-dependent enzyme [Acidimicrobiia bacterium]